MKKTGFIAEGTACDHCEQIIEKQAMKVEGVQEVTFDLSTETGYVTYDPAKTDIDKILYKIEEKGYKCFILDENNKSASGYNGALAWIFAILGIVIAGYFIFGFVESIQLPAISQNMGYGLLFVVGLLTGFHCISMCGGFVVSYTAKNAQEGKNSHGSHILYGAGKLVSYTVIGAVFGLIGSIIAFTPTMRGVVGLLAGLFLVLFGLRMLNVFPILRRISIPSPKLLSRYTGKNSSPLVIGLLNGLMIACGPLQAIYIMAAGTGSLVEGAKLLFIFGLGTLPAMIAFGYFASFVSAKMTAKILKASGVIVIVLGLIMINNGLVLTGTGFDMRAMLTSVSATENEIGVTDSPLLGKDGYQEIRMEVTRSGWQPDEFVLKKGVPVKWIIDGKEITGCNNAIQVPRYGLEFDIKQGEQVIEFTPDEEGIVRWSCWMGMIPGVFVVKDDINLEDTQEVKKALSTAPKQAVSGGSCGGSCGGSTCGAATGGSCGCGG